MDIPQYHAGAYKEGSTKLSSNENNYGVSSVVYAAIQESIKNIHMYPPSKHTELQEAIGEQLAISPEHLVLGNGSDEIISFLTRMTLSSGDVTMSARETFSVYNIATCMERAKMHTVPLDNGYFDLEAIAQASNTYSPKIVFICNPNNPTGTYHDNNVLKACISNIPESSYVLLDEAYIDFVDTNTMQQPASIGEKLTWHPKLIIMRTFSKAYALGGIRLGMGISHPHIIQELSTYRMPFNINRFAYNAGLAAIKDNSSYIKNRDNIIQSRNELLQQYTEYGYEHYPSQANFIACNMHTPNKPHKDAVSAPYADLAYSFFAEHNIMIRSLTSFGLPKMVRITVGTPQDNKKVCALLNLWHSLHRYNFT